MQKSENRPDLAGSDRLETIESNDAPDNTNGRNIDQDLIAEIDKSPTQKIRITRSVYKGRLGIDVRLFEIYRTTGLWGPTARGLRIDPALLPALIEALQRAAA